MGPTDTATATKDDTMTPTTPTMQALATRLGVSKSTISLAMRNDPRIAQATREKVQHTADTMGYRMNGTISSLMGALRLGRECRGCNVALVLPAACEPTREFLAGLQERLALSGRKTEVFRLADVSAERLCCILDARGIEGAVIVDSEHATTALAASGQYCVRFLGKPTSHQDGFLAGIVVCDSLHWHRETVVCLKTT